MDPLEQLRRNLNAATEAALANPRLEDLSRLHTEFTKLTSWLGGGSGMDAPAEDRIVAAVKAYYQTAKLNGLGHARLVCYGSTQFVDSKTYRLIEDRRRFSKLLTYVDQHHDRPRPFRRCYRGLLNGYFSYDPDDPASSNDGRSNWRDLRRFLYERRESVVTPGFNPEWVAGLKGHHNLLTEEPCKKYGSTALAGDSSAFDDARNRLEIRDDSWVIRRYIDAQFDAAVAQSDRKFRELIPKLLALLEEHTLLLDSNLGKVINRYWECTNKDVDAQLRDFSVAHWKNPWLPSNAARWGSVRTEAKDMIATWLKLQLIGQFFSLLAEDGSNDTRRVEFWKQYHDDIEDMYFALGNSAMYNSSPDFKEMRKAMEGRLLHLDGTGWNTNAFIMMIGDYVVVEFGTIGNAAFIYSRHKDLPFRLSGRVTANSRGLKNEGCPAFVNRLVHRGDWEDTFAHVLRRRIGVQPGTVSRTSTTRAPATKSPPRFSETALVLFATEHGLVLNDLRPRGGSLWLSASRALTAEAQFTLKAWGFRWSDRRRAFYREE